LAATGDLLSHSPVAARAAIDGGGHDFAPLLAPVAPLISQADLAICHLETPLARPGQRPSYFPVFQVPGALAAAIAATGWDRCSTASNHSLDAGAAGVAATLDLLDAAGVAHQGTARSQAEADELPRFEVQGVQVGHLAYAYGFNGFPVPDAEPWLAERLDPEVVLADAADLRRAGAAFVVVSLHWGLEHVVAPTAEQSALAHRLLASPDIDLILGHHAHVVQPVEQVGEKFAVYGLGNFLSNQSAACCPAATQDGVIVRADVTEQADGRFLVTALEGVPTMVQRGTYRVLPVAATLADPATPPALRAALQASWHRTATTMNTLVPAVVR
jgi:poly-gamma-glutamate synthesis protein (capsule biosynthesis protein)